MPLFLLFGNEDGEFKGGVTSGPRVGRCGRIRRGHLDADVGRGETAQIRDLGSS